MNERIKKLLNLLSQVKAEALPLLEEDPEADIFMELDIMYDHIEKVVKELEEQLED